MLAFYYPWYGTPERHGHWVHWDNVRADRHDIGSSRHYPARGAYDSYDPAIIDWHIDSARTNGVTGFISSWWGRNGYEDRVVPLLLESAARKNFKVSVYWETAPDRGSAQIERAIQDLVYLLARYGTNQAFLKVNGRPVIFVYGRVMGQVPLESWPAIINGARAKAGDFLLIADGYDANYGRLFDGVHTYNIAGFVAGKSPATLRPAIAIPMFFGYAFGPVVGFFTGAVGNTFGDAISGFGLSPQWSIGNGLVGFIAGMAMLFKDKKRSMDTVLWISGILAVVTVALFLINPKTPNGMYFDPDTGTFGETPLTIFAGITILIGFILVLIVRFAFANNEDVAAAVTWGMLGNILGILFAALSDIFINGFSLVAAIVGEFLPAAGPNLIFAAILVPLLVGAYAAVQRQSGR